MCRLRAPVCSPPEMLSSRRSIPKSTSPASSAVCCLKHILSIGFDFALLAYSNLRQFRVLLDACVRASCFVVHENSVPVLASSAIGVRGELSPALTLKV